VFRAADHSIGGAWEEAWESVGADVANLMGIQGLRRAMVEGTGFEPVYV
jgi:hypothetical protein